MVEPQSENLKLSRPGMLGWHWTPHGSGLFSGDVRRGWSQLAMLPKLGEGFTSQNLVLRRGWRMDDAEVRWVEASTDAM